MIERLSTSEISDLTFSSRSTVSKYLEAFGIALRVSSEARSLRPGQVAYGKQLRNGRMVACKTEQRIILKMAGLRHRGYSYGKIAQVLNDLGFRTKNGRGGWHATTVMKILKTLPTPA